MTPEQKRAVDRFVETVKEHYGERLVDVVLFGSRARGDARDDSDFDLAVILRDGDWVEWRERNWLASIAYDAFIEADACIQPWPMAARTWQHPEHQGHKSRLIEQARRDGIPWSVAA